MFPRGSASDILLLSLRLRIVSSSWSAAIPMPASITESESGLRTFARLQPDYGCGGKVLTLLIREAGKPFLLRHAQPSSRGLSRRAAGRLSTMRVELKFKDCIVGICHALDQGTAGVSRDLNCPSIVRAASHRNLRQRRFFADGVFRQRSLQFNDFLGSHKGVIEFSSVHRRASSTGQVVARDIYGGTSSARPIPGPCSIPRKQPQVERIPHSTTRRNRTMTSGDCAEPCRYLAH